MNGGFFFFDSQKWKQQLLKYTGTFLILATLQIRSISIRSVNVVFTLLREAQSVITSVSLNSDYKSNLHESMCINHNWPHEPRWGPSLASSSFRAL